MKNKYIEELNTIQTDSAFKEQLIQKMEKQRNSKVDLTSLYIKLTLGCICACLIFISIFTYKTYQETQFLKQQVVSTNKQIEKLYNKFNDKNIDNFIARNDDEIKDVEIEYSNPLLQGGFGSGDIFPGMTINEFDTTDFEIVNQSHYYDKLPIGARYQHTFTIKEKKEILNNFINQLKIEKYNFYNTNDYLTIVSDKYSIEIKNDIVKINFKNYNEKIDIETFLDNNPILFKDDYKLKKIDDSNNRDYYVLYQKVDDELIEFANAIDEISIEIIYEQDTVIEIDYTNCFKPIHYNAITYNQALKQLEKDECYYVEGMKEYSDINKIYCTRLMYMFDMESESWLPYYQFFVGTKNLDKAQQNGFIIEDDEYVLSVYVPAISEEYVKHKKDYEINIAQ